MKRTTDNFVDIYRESNEIRLGKLSENIGLVLPTTKRKSIEQVLDFLRNLDLRFMTFDPKLKIDSILGEMFYFHITSDFRSLIILAITYQNYQVNIILRHLIEIFVISFWADIFSNFNNTFTYLLRDKKWKPYRPNQRVTWEYDKRNPLPHRSIKERLERIRLLNYSSKKGKKFYKEYFNKCTQCDLYVLFDLPICKECINENNNKKYNYQIFHLNESIRKKGKEDIHAVYKSDFGFICSICGKQKKTIGHATGIPDVVDMLEMLISVLDDNIIINVSNLKKIYSYLSENFVHYSTNVDPDGKPKKYHFNNKNILLWGFKGILFLIEVIEPLLEYYFKLFRRKVNQKSKKRKYNFTKRK